MIRFIENIGDYYSQHFFTDNFAKKVFDKAGYVTQKKDSDGKNTDNHLTAINGLISRYSAEGDHVIPWQTEHVFSWRTSTANAVSAFQS